MKIVLINVVYPSFLERLAEQHPTIETLSYDSQTKLLFNQRYGWTSDLAEALRELGHQVIVLYTNVHSVQKAWARQKDLIYSERNWELKIAEAQIKEIRPGFLLIPSYFEYFGNWSARIKNYCDQIGAWVACPHPSDLRSDGIDILMTSAPHLVEDIAHQFREIVVTLPGYREDLPEKFNLERKFDISFIGQVTPMHTRRTKVLAELIRRGIKIEFFGSVQNAKFGFWETALSSTKWLLKGHAIRAVEEFRNLARTYKFHKNSTLMQAHCRGPIFGNDLLRTYAQSKIVVNGHIDCSTAYANNMRLFEATLMGACVLTEHTPNIEDVFVPDKEIVTYKNINEAEKKIRYLLSHESERAEIARLGQARARSDYTNKAMAEKLHRILIPPKKAAS